MTGRARTYQAAVAGTLAAVLAGALGGCAAASGEEHTTLTVFAAASLQDSFEKIAKDFESDHRDVDVALSFAGSSSLVEQIQQGAPADVVASADTATMGRLVDDDLVGTPKDFASNTLEIAVPPGNPAGVETLADLADPGVALVQCAPAVPCGAAAATVERAAGLGVHPVSEEQSVTDVLGKVISGEADAGLVYVTDVRQAGDDVEGVRFDEAARAVNTYPIATVDRSDQSELAREFVDLVLSKDGQSVLAGHGFAAP